MTNHDFPFSLKFLVTLANSVTVFRKADISIKKFKVLLASCKTWSVSLVTALRFQRKVMLFLRARLSGMDGRRSAT